MQENVAELLALCLDMAKYWRIPLSDIEAMSLEEFREAQQIALKRIEDEKRSQSAPSGGRYKRIS